MKPRETKATLKALAEIRLQKIETLMVENAALRRQLEARLDVSMLEQRNKLASNVGQMIQALSQMVYVVIGKEAL